jgi:hypothetical protein
MPGKGWFTILRLFSPLEPFFAKTWRPSEIALVRRGISRPHDASMCIMRAASSDLNKETLTGVMFSVLRDHV